MSQPILITGCAGFIGFHLARRLLQDHHLVIGLDNLNDYYDVSLKHARLAQLTPDPNFTFIQASLEDRDTINQLFDKHRPATVIHLAAQAGVRYSLQNPHAYIDANIVGFMNILEACRHHHVNHLIYASSSSVYGANSKLPYSVGDPVDHPVSLYAATKKANELMAHTYSHLYGIPTTGLRFFTVYGPWGRPDMAYFTFTKKMLAGEPIEVYNHGNMKRDFTYIDDIVEGVIRLIPKPPESKYKIYNIGNHQPVNLLDFIQTLEDKLGTRANIKLMPMQPGDVTETFADIDDLKRDTGFRPNTPLDQGLGKFVEWYRSYYG